MCKLNFLIRFVISKTFYYSDNLKKLTQLAMLIRDAVAISETFWAAAKLDMKHLENRADNTEEVTNLLQDCKKRIDQLEINSRTQKLPDENIQLQRMQKILKKVLSLDSNKISTMESCVMEILSLENRLNVLTNAMCEQKSISRVLDFINEM